MKQKAFKTAKKVKIVPKRKRMKREKKSNTLEVVEIVAKLQGLPVFSLKSMRGRDFALIASPGPSSRDSIKNAEILFIILYHYLSSGSFEAMKKFMSLDTEQRVKLYNRIRKKYDLERKTRSNP